MTRETAQISLTHIQWQVPMHLSYVRVLRHAWSRWGCIHRKWETAMVPSMGIASASTSEADDCPPLLVWSASRVAVTAVPQS